MKSFGDCLPNWLHENCTTKMMSDISLRIAVWDESHTPISEDLFKKASFKLYSPTRPT